MGRNDIKLDQINARLGDMNKPRQYDNYSDDQPQFDNGDDGGDDDGGGATFNAGFIASILALFLAVSGGTYIFTSGTNPLKSINIASISMPWSSGYVSVVDKSCGAGWREGYPNDTQLKCYLTQNIKRLCKPEEQKRLVAVLSRYRDDKSRYDAGFAVSMVGMIGKAQTEGMAMGMAAAKMERDMRDPNVSQEKQMEQMDNVIGMGQDIMEGPNSLMRNRGEVVPQQQLVNAIREIMNAGLMSKSDFGWFPDDLVYIAGKNVRVKGKVCG
jgi:hypothetical protein